MTSIRPRQINRSLRSIAAIAVVSTAALSSCGESEERSTERFCEVLRTEQDRLSSEYQDQADALTGDGVDPLVGLFGAFGMLASAQGDLIVYFERLERVAPESIQPEVAAVRDSMKDQASAAQNAASDPLGALLGGVMAGLQNMGSFDRVSRFAQTNCGRNI